MGQLKYNLNNPGYTIYHRAALGGLAATLQAWRNEGLVFEKIKYEYDGTGVSIEWEKEIADTEVLTKLLAESFRITKEKLIDLPGHGLESYRRSLKVAIHNAITGTFLQHNKMRPGEKEARKIDIANADKADQPSCISYKPVNSYAHQHAQGTGLLDKQGPIPERAKVPQSVVPGAMSGAIALEVPGEEAFLLLYLMVGCPLYLIRSNSSAEKIQYGILVPDVTDLRKFVSKIQRNTFAIAQSYLRSDDLDYESRVAGGVEDAALHFLVGLDGGEHVDVERTGIRGFLSVAMGKVAWDANQINRSAVRPVQVHYGELDIYRAANGSELSQRNKILLKSGDVFVVPASPLPALVAANLVSDRHWCEGLRELVNNQSEFQRLHYMRGGLRAMKRAIRNEEDQAIVQAFQEGLKYMYGQKGERAKNEGSDFGRLASVELERIRNSVLRMKTMESLSGWFIQFCVSGTEGGQLPAFRQHRALLLSFFQNERNYARLQNLILFAMLSYEGKDSNKA